MKNEIRNYILSINKPFTYVTLSFYMRHYHGIKNMKLVPEVIEELCEDGILKKHHSDMFTIYFKETDIPLKLREKM